MRAKIRKVLGLELKPFSQKPEDRPLIGTAGTVTTLAAMVLELAVYEPDAVNNFRMERKALEGLFHKMAGMRTAERAELPGLSEKRADVILAGTLVVLEIMNFLKINQIIASDAGLLEGLWLAAAQKRRVS
jgi:exopolyphosphatase/guanosine-5'-triphosphate,3'-diphosphate pyrophosphatase